MSTQRSISLVVLLIGIGVLAFGIWQYFDSRSELRIGDARLVIEDAEVSPAVWIGGAIIIAGGAALVAARGKRA